MLFLSIYEGPSPQSDSGSSIKAKNDLLCHWAALLLITSVGASTSSSFQIPYPAKPSILETMLAVWVSTLATWQRNGTYRPSPQDQIMGAASGCRGDN